MKKAFLHISAISVLAVLVISTVCESVPPLALGSRASSPNKGLAGIHGSPVLNEAVRTDLQYVDRTTVGAYSAEYGIDFRLVLAMIKQESRFNEDAVSERGARGLMQVMPATHSEIADEIELHDPYLPHENLRAGIYYVAKLTELFKAAKGKDKICLALAAYNAGPSRIYDAQELAAYLGEDPVKWSSIRTMLPLLSKRYYSLHGLVWGADRPPNGYYGSAGQTIQYVDNIMKTYQEYCKPAS